ncbi:Rho family GTPase [Entamoeba histolytica HM-1:IMSS-B]|uniref:small monomeric GTPase n=9 Tax=Entamoeba TaxID=5758 RepID=C4M3R0_ENTH1|nr:GTPase_rho, putative [Entamoeba dispar SAW760]XP_008857951.1 Rho family GTPase [Entamoeba nuttalli P19]XP_653308.1 Rho family GTPase [Entamoeba histolytica HM-1:IMSS]EMD46194.1 Rho GTPase, putative [Entamoeba histolytica KU27]EMH74484.1 Rho family GTPase [Entamoeba histolytica HM-1:IMSS-B]EMS12747.1 Rho GTPase, putative [Entamoeba histolytica HM-3:IMSS]ENY65196.1 GTPase, putative [Entamoeba histolytica HM-1:IMSS-A]BAN38450.1 rho family GTPase [Entamoeba histolytica]|eukprot:EDR26621.1 GTPase_rho, putative [Entamoeba dispar SAW760]
MAEIKVIVIGDTNVGKTCLLLTYTTNSFPDTYVPTVFDNYTAPISVDKKTVQMNLWDTSGSDDLDEMRPLSYADTDCFMICFSIADEDSFERIKTKWVPEIRDNCGKDDPKIIIVGTKSDVRNNPNAIDVLKKQGKDLVKKESIEVMAKEVGAQAFCECSAITQSGLKEIFELAAKVSMGLLDAVVSEAPQAKEKKKGMFSKIFGKKDKKEKKDKK